MRQHWKSTLAALFLALSAGLGLGTARAEEAPIRIGVLSDMSGHLADMSGPTTVQAVRMAAADFGGSVLGRKIEVLSADHQNKPDIGMAILRKWYDVDGVDLVLDVDNSALALAAQQLTRERNKIAIYGGAFSTDLTGKNCSPNGIVWVTDTFSQSSALVAQEVHDGADTWFTLAPNYAFGISAQNDVASAVTANGGKVLGSLLVPTPAGDMSSFVLQAQSSGAKMIEVLQGGTDLQNALKTAHEFGLGMPGKPQLATIIFWMTDALGVGLDTAQGLRSVNAFYWDLNDKTRAWAQRFNALAGRMPDAVHAGMYSAAMHYLKAVQAAGTNESGAVLARMKATPVNDFMTENGQIRADGRLVRDMYILQVKSPAESTSHWDVFKLVSTIPAERTVRPLSQSACPLVTH